MPFLKARDPVSNRQRQQLAVISEFVTDIAHVPGLQNVVADALTRQFDDQEVTARVHTVAHALTDINLGDLAADQPPLSGEARTSLVLEQVQFPGVDRPLVCDTSLGRPRVLVPVSWRKKIFEAVHNLAHPSGKATLGIVARTYVWTGMRKDVQSWARQCQACQTSKVALHTKPPVRSILVPKERFHQVHVDIVGPFAPDKGFRYLLTMVDRTTRWPEVIPIADTTAETIMSAFLDGWVARFGVPAEVITDRGAQFTSDLWKKTLSKLGIDAKTTTAYHPQANGMVERFHRTLKNALRCAVRSSKSWVRSLPWVLLGLRNAPKLDTSTSTAEVVYGTPLRVPGACFQSDQAQRKTATEQLESARANVAAFSPETLDLRRFKVSPFIAGSLRTASHVFVRDDRLGKPSLAAKYTGPYEVKNRDWANNTFLLDLGGKEDKVSLSRLKAAVMAEEAT